MAIVKSEAVILRVVDYSETSQIIAALSPVAGLVSAIAKGSRKPARASSRLSAIDLLSRVQLVYYEKRGDALDTLTEYTVFESYPNVRGTLARWSAGLCVVDLARLAARPSNADRPLYDSVCRALTHLDDPSVDSTLALIDFFARYLAALGFAPDLSHCAASDKPLDRVAKARVVYTEGRAYAVDAPAGALGMELDCIALQVLQRFVAGTRKPLQAVSLPDSIARPVANTLMGLITAALESQPLSFGALIL